MSVDCGEMTAGIDGIEARARRESHAGPGIILTAMGVAFVAAAVLLGVFGWPRRRPGPPCLTQGGSWASGSGSSWDVGMLGYGLHWPPRDDQDRLLALVLPAVVVSSCWRLSPSVPRWLIWPLRLVRRGGGRAGFAARNQLYHRPRRTRNQRMVAGRWPG